MLMPQMNFSHFVVDTAINSVLESKNFLGDTLMENRDNLFVSKRQYFVYVAASS